MFVIASFLDPRLSSGAWFGIGLVYFVTSLNFQTRFLEKFLLNSGEVIDKREVKFINSIISALSLIIIYLLFPILAVCFIVFSTGDIEAKLLFLKQLEDIFPFVNLNEATLFGITQGSDVQTHPIGILQPLVIFWQLALIELLIFLSIRQILKYLSNSAMVYLNIVLGIHVVLMIVSLLGFSFFLGENSFPGALTPISFMWLMTFGAVFVALRGLIKEHRIIYGFIQFAILIITFFILTYAAISNQILNLKYFLFFQFIFFAMVFLLLKAHNSRNTNEVSLSTSLDRSYRILNFVSLFLIVALPILVFLLKIQPSSSPESTVYFSLILSLLPSVFLLNYGRRLSKTLNISNWLFAHLWVVDRRSRINF